MADALVGTWNFDSSDNMSGFLGSFPNMPETVKSAAGSSKPTVEISKDGNTWTIKTTRGSDVQEGKYTEGQEADGPNFLGKPCKVTLTLEGSSLVEIQKSGERAIKVTHSVQGGNYVKTLDVKGNVATVKFTKA